MTSDCSRQRCLGFVSALLFCVGCTEAGLNFKLLKRPKANPETNIANDCSCPEPVAVCDRELAKSMVIFGEERDAAVSAKEDYKARLVTAEDNVQYLSDKLHESETSVHELKEAIEQQKEEGDDALEKQRLQMIGHEVELQSKLKLESDNRASFLEAKIKQLEEAMEMQRQSMQDAATKREKEFQEEQRQAQLSKEEEIRLLEEKSMGQIKILERKTEELQTRNQKHSADHKSEMELAKTIHNEEMDALEAEFTKKIASKEAESSAKALKVETDLKTNTEKINKKLAACNRQKEETELARDALEKVHSKALKELSYWDNIYGQRTYCNFTYIAEDASATARSAGQTMYSKMLPVYETKVLPVYNKYLKETVDKMEPIFRLVAARLQKGLDAYNDLCARGFNAMTSNLRASCPQVRSKVKKFRMRKSGAAVQKALEWSVDKVCSDVDHLLVMLLWSLGVTGLYCSGGLIWRSFTAIVCMPFRIVLALPRLAAGQEAPAKDCILQKTKSV